MDIGRNAARLELLRLVRPAAGDQRERRLVLPDGLALLVPERLRHEAQHADTPGAITDPGGRLGKELVHLLAAHQRQRQEGQPPCFGDVRRELRIVRDTRHRPLHQGVTGAVRDRQRRALGQMPLLRCDAQRGETLLADGLDDPGHALVPHARADADALTHGTKPALAPSDPRRKPVAPLLGGNLASLRLAQHVLRCFERFAARSRINAAWRAEKLAQTARLRAVQSRQLGLELGRQRRFVTEQHLIVEHHTGRPGGAQRGGCVLSDAAAHEHGQLRPRQPLLDQHVARVLTAPARGLEALGNDAVRLELAELRVGIRDFQIEAVSFIHPAARLAQRACKLDGSRARAAGNQHQRAVRRGGSDDLHRQIFDFGNHPEPDLTVDALGNQPREMRSGQGPVRAEFQIDDANTTGARGGNGHAGMRPGGRAQCDDVERLALRHDVSLAPAVAGYRASVSRRTPFVIYPSHRV